MKVRIHKDHLAEDVEINLGKHETSEHHAKYTDDGKLKS